MLVADMRSLRDQTASWVLVNTFDELERAAIDALRAHLPAVLPVGPLFRAEDDDDAHDEEDECAAWLDARPPRSVVFVAFGSLVKPSREDMAELAEGLVSTGRPFLWVVRHDTRDLLPDDHLRNEKNKMGKVVPWCRQRRVLAHPAVGCFVTHCGWNSTVEALAAGVPVVTYPSWSDQPTNAKLLVDGFGVGVRLPVPPTRDALRRCVEEVMAGPGAEAMRGRVGEWKAKAAAAVAPGGSADRGVQDFVDAVRLI
ncbi:hypothetical protein PR202_gb05160 [Eleusine coracana subsp. coracana]|uniref:UDP-glycosyltransferases domain-containing protein n=1 Tax=Eleusine coracana subsp. coracana TaxID=191504 RepID=A0AAV5E6H8_ELECO|nr:hypothetical protein PR202_gb05160 [Eleusine coracana subsp. coracana]